MDYLDCFLLVVQKHSVCVYLLQAAILNKPSEDRILAILID